MLRGLHLGFAALLAVAGLSGCAGWIGSDQRESNAEVILLSFGSTNGEIEPCG